MPADLLLTILATLATLALIIGVLAYRYVFVDACWVCWFAARWDRGPLAWIHVWHMGRIDGEPEDLPGQDNDARLTQPSEAVRGLPLAGESDWGDELHAINQAIHQDRPVAQLTHYEIEHLIRQLGIPEWLPPRLLERAAA